MADETTSNESTGGAIKDADLIRYSEESAGTFASKKQTLGAMKTYFNAGVVVVGNEWLTPETVAPAADPVYSLGDGTAQTFASYGKSLAEAQADAPNANVTEDTDLVDWAFSCEAEFQLMNSAKQNQIDYGLYGMRKYVINKPIILPTTTTKSSKRFIHQGHGCEITTSNTTNIFESVPADQTDADLYIARQLSFLHFYINGIGGAKGNGQTGVQIGGAKHVTFTDCEMAGCDINVDLMFCLFASMEDCQLTNATTYNAWLHCGLDAAGSALWTGATLSNSASNDCDLYNIEIFNALESDYGLFLQGVSDINVNGCTTEGPESGTQADQPIAGIYYDDLNSTVVKGFVINGLHAEQSYTDSIVKIKAREGMFQINDLFNHKQGLYATENRIIWNAESIAGEVYVNLQNYRYAQAFQQFGLIGAAISKAYVRPDFTRCALNNSPQDALDLQADAAMWSDQIPDFCSIIPKL